MPAAALFAALQILSGPDFLVLAVSGGLTGLALIAVWKLQDLTNYRSEQARLSQQALLDLSWAAESGKRDG